MSAIYKIIGQDGKEYGPVTAEQLRQWIAEGRVERGRRCSWTARRTGISSACCRSSRIVSRRKPPVIGPSGPGHSSKSNSHLRWRDWFAEFWPWICCCGFPFNLLGITFSQSSPCRKSAAIPEIYEGRGLAIAGLILSIAPLLFFSGS
jgi:hypothetical protein